MAANANSVLNTVHNVYENKFKPHSSPKHIQPKSLQLSQVEDFNTKQMQYNIIKNTSHQLFFFAKFHNS